MHPAAFLLPALLCAFAAIESGRIFVSIVLDEWPHISPFRAAGFLACIAATAAAAAIAFAPPLAWIAGALAR
jgi:hypothetical protein